VGIYNELGRISSLDYKNLMRHLNILEKTFLIKMVTPYCKNKRTEIAKSPKIYFCDNGFRNMIIGSFQRLSERVDRGLLNENFVAGQLLKQGFDIKYWRTKSGAEIDFVIEDREANIAVEVKSVLSSHKIGKAVYNFREKYAVDKIIILSENLSFIDRERRINFLPIFFI
jgi:predicted AAA+ superfamily ATPase